MARGRTRQYQFYWGSFVLGWFREMRNSNLGGPEYRVLFYLCEKMKNEDNIAYIKQKELARRLRMDKGNISKSVKKLRDNQFIAKCEYGYMINPHLFYTGMNRALRSILRNRFDNLLLADNLEPKYYLNDDEYVLEVNGSPISDDDELLEEE
ncbi:replication/maintenance protein RepL [Bacillus sp. UNC438CL73TsuS30]|uniref:replication/maintenance protein RepL n=1 Tax=Bacillus sp. UNC438CL73TsuS30 TaxID=1340434 RepID=UPI000479918E|nr:replication/maintenance protein RepL [Bacillus sp. UNC438CL73TsuS30]